MLSLVRATAVLSFFAATVCYGSVTWQAGPVLMMPGKAGTFDETAVKDPSVVFAGGRWHVFYTARGQGRYSIGYASATTLEGLLTAPRREISQLRGDKENYAAAPQVFYFRPHRKWYLIYQTRDANYQPVFSTSDNVGDPGSWTAPRNLVDKTESAKWIDFWVICDSKTAYLFYTRSHKQVMVMSTPLPQFPAGFSDPTPVVSPLIEAAHVYKLSGPKDRYIMLYEWGEQDHRRFAVAEAEHLRGPWSVTNLQFAVGDNLKFLAGADAWTREVSHGELLRNGIDERLEVHSNRLQFLIQGIPAGLHRGEYVDLPWRLGVISADDALK